MCNCQVGNILWTLVFVLSRGFATLDDPQLLGPQQYFSIDIVWTASPRRLRKQKTTQTNYRFENDWHVCTSIRLATYWKLFQTRHSKICEITFLHFLFWLRSLCSVLHFWFSMRWYVPKVGHFHLCSCCGRTQQRTTANKTFFCSQQTLWKNK